jgi:hypothetical protein
LTEDTDRGRKREDALKALLGRICCVVGLLFGVGGIIFAILSASVNVSAGAVGIVLGLVDHRRGHDRALLHGGREHRPGRGTPGHGYD